MAVAVEVRNISRVFPQNFYVFKGMTFSIEPGEKVGVVGANGSGKTTLLKLLASLLLPTEGQVLILGKDTRKQASAVRELVGWVSASDTVFFPRLNGRENLHLFLAHKVSKKEIDNRISHWIPHLPLKEALATPYYLCSTGMRQALNFCRALILDPEILILDEPTRGLDQESVTKIVQTINSEFKEKTLVVASHDKSFVEKITDREIRLQDYVQC